MFSQSLNSLDLIEDFLEASHFARGASSDKGLILFYVIKNVIHLEKGFLDALLFQQQAVG